MTSVGRLTGRKREAELVLLLSTALTERLLEAVAALTVP